MISINIKSNVKDVTKWLNRVERKQIPYATQLAINSTAFDVMRKERADMSKHIQNPTRFTETGVVVEKATKQNLTATVKIPDNRADYMQYAVFGGSRPPKGRANVFPRAARLNKFGNLSKRFVSMNLAKPKIFSGQPAGRKPGIYQRMGTKRKPKLRMLAEWGGIANYQKRYPFHDIAQREVNKVFDKNFSKGFDKAMQGAK